MMRVILPLTLECVWLHFHDIITMMMRGSVRNLYGVDAEVWFHSKLWKNVKVVAASN